MVNMKESIEELINGKGIVVCQNKKGEILYLDIEEHIFYTEEEITEKFGKEE